MSKIKNAPKPEKSDDKLKAINSPAEPVRAAPTSAMKIRINPTVTVGLISFSF